MHALRRIALLISILLLTACAGPRLIDSTVNSFAQWPAGQPFSPSTYRFERLPSQSTPQAAARQEQVESLARQALNKAGLQYEAVSPQYSVLAQALIEPLATDPIWMSGHGPWGGLPGRDFLVNGRGQVIPIGMPFFNAEPIMYRRQVSLVMRQIDSGVIVFETHALSEGPGFEASGVLSAMFEAALAGYPLPKPGPRQVLVDTAP
jgi:hypothetical protein